MPLRKIAAQLLPASQLKRSTTDLCVYGICLLVGKFPVASAFIYVQEFYSFVTPHRISKAVVFEKQSEILDSTGWLLGKSSHFVLFLYFTA